MIYVLPRWAKTDLFRVDVTSRGTDYRGLSPFFLGPVRLPSWHMAQNVENAWQYSKVYEGHVDKTGAPTPEWWAWATAGWAKTRADRYPMGKGAKPLYSLWGDKRLGYIDARKHIYAPLYADAVIAERDLLQNLRDLHITLGDLAIIDFDAYDHHALGMSLTDVLNDPSRKMGHGFVLAMLLEDDPALEYLAD